MSVLTVRHRKIVTKDSSGAPNGWLLPIFNAGEGVVSAAQHPRQVYLTVVAPRTIKGPHLHLKRWGLFTCIRGNVRIVIRDAEGRYHEHMSGEDHEFMTIQVPAGTPAALQNAGDTDAYVLNMPSPEWRQDDQDEHSVSFHDYTFAWPADT